MKSTISIISILFCSIVVTVAERQEQSSANINSSGITSVEVWMPDGKIKEIFYYNKGKEIAKETFDNNGDVVEKTGIIPDGEVKEYYENGKIKKEAYFENNKREGETRLYFKNGTLQGKYNYKNDKLDGPYIQYSEYTEYMEKYPNLPHLYYYEEGNYQNGKREGVFKQYYLDDKKIKVKGNIKNGKLDGILKEYAVDGFVEYKMVFNNGLKVKEKHYKRWSDNKLYKTVSSMKYSRDVHSFLSIVMVLLPIILFRLLCYKKDNLTDKIKIKIGKNIALLIGTIGVISCILIYTSDLHKYFIGLVPGWIIISMVMCNNISKNKGRSKVLWSALSFFLGYIAVIILATLPSLESNAVIPDKTENIS